MALALSRRTSGLPDRPARRDHLARAAPPVGLAPHRVTATLRASQGTNPLLTLQLAREGNRRFPDSVDAPERAWMIAKSLTDLGRFREARAEAQIAVNRYAGTSWALDLQRHLLSNPLD